MSENNNSINLIRNITGNSNRLNAEKEELYKLLTEAREEWQTAQNVFNNVSDPGLVDFAIYNMKAAEKKYVYLMQKAKEMDNPPNQLK